MFIIERLFGVFTYSYFLILFFILLMFSKISHRGLLKCYTVILSVMAFFYEPYVTADLYRINETIEWFSTYNFTDFFRTFVIGSTNPSARIIYWLTGKTGIVQLLPFFTCLICYSCIFYIIIRTAERYDISRRSIALAVLFFMSIGNYIIVISNIRTMLALSLICFCFFRETVEKRFRFWHLALYLFAATLHNMALIVIVIRVSLLFIDKHISFLKRFSVLVCAFTAFAVASIVFHSAFQNILNKVLIYLEGEQYSYMWEYIIGTVVFMVEAIIIFANKKDKLHDTSDLISTRHFLTICLLISLMFSYEFSIFHRFATYIAPILTLPMMLLALDKQEKTASQQGSILSYSNLILASSVCMLFLACFRGSMCSFKFFTF